MTDKKDLRAYLSGFGIELWEKEKIVAFQQALLDWYDQNKRRLPWRETTDPYKIWVSEIMLQQTQVATVIPYYLNFLQKFPTIQHLAAADPAALEKAWEGLGYYSRVRNMKEAAQTIQKEFGGVFPKEHKAVLSLKGIGPYTAGAIMSIAFNEPYPAVDGNVMRILARLFEIDLDIGDPKNKKVFECLCQALISQERPGDFNQALMDLGSDIEAARGYHVEDSPVKEFSGAYINETMDRYPIKKKRVKVQKQRFKALIIETRAGQFLFRRRPAEGLLANFYLMPLLEVEQDIAAYLTDLGFPHFLIGKKALGQVKHVFSHREWLIDCWYVQVEETIDLPSADGYKWLWPTEFSQQAFPKPQHKIWELFAK